ncbi:T99 [Tupaiid betaherpesvirus 1]|uniref:Cytoplasmic envelopment protein 3 n=1 Tax=Tupaiid herpesvirus 1 (strain 1) TaxID=10397 RepID=Q91TK5_TUHV1|nr:T99 [Tupaiid betaherpesvirus 1]AAK57142.1 T99 [Tupaiid betaherpesvirus 1]
MGSQCCKRLCDQLDAKASHTLIDYCGQPIDLQKNFTVLTDTSSDDDDDDRNPSTSLPAQLALADSAESDAGDDSEERARGQDGANEKLMPPAPSSPVGASAAVTRAASAGRSMSRPKGQRPGHRSHYRDLQSRRPTPRPNRRVVALPV